MSGRRSFFGAALCCALAFTSLSIGPIGASAAMADTTVSTRDSASLRVAQQAAEIMVHERISLKTIGADRLAVLSGAKAGGETEVSTSSRQIDPKTLPPKLDTGTLDVMAPVSGDAQWRCLAEAIYYESRGEPLSGQIAVAEVVLNRVDSRQYPNSVCAVTKQGVERGRSCQFSYACDGRPERMADPVSRDRSEKLAAIMMSGRDRTVTDGATHFHARYVRPGWASRLTRTAQIGQHIFYRQGSRVAQR